MFHRLSKTVLVLLGLTASLQLGCQKGETLGQVAGVVTFQDEPVSEGVILFSNAERGVYISAELAEDGGYRVSMASGYGLPPGTYDVAITPPIIDHPVGPILERPKPTVFANIPARYHKADSSGLSLTVTEGKNEFNVNMKP